ncbi:MAG: methylenetetrahydrofolate reductase [bacterium]|nr:methylenetetrahydrofolate reductase [bacterium]MDD5755995.1 methylenetetrahydrofolate reductase [bacterium]
MKFAETLKTKKFIITAELFPPKGINVQSLLDKAKLLRGKIDGFNVTDNQRAVMRLGSLAICRLLLDQGCEPIMQMTCRDRNRIALQSDLLSANTLGVENILILSGDHPSQGDHKEAKPVYDLDPVQLLKTARALETGVDLAGKKLDGSPQFCLGAVVNPMADPLDLQLAMVEKKIEAGAQFFQTQPIFDFKLLETFVARTRDLPAKILIGVFLLKSAQVAIFMKEKLGINISPHYIDRLSRAASPVDEGINIAAELISQLKPHVDGVHIMALGLEEHISEILDKVK